MEVKIGAIEGEAVDRQTIIDIIKHEEAQIAAEKAETKKRKAKEEELKQIVCVSQNGSRTYFNSFSNHMSCSVTSLISFLRNAT